MRSIHAIPSLGGTSGACTFRMRFGWQFCITKVEDISLRHMQYLLLVFKKRMLFFWFCVAGGLWLDMDAIVLRDDSLKVRMQSIRHTIAGQ